MLYVELCVSTVAKGFDLIHVNSVVPNLLQIMYVLCYLKKTDDLLPTCVSLFFKYYLWRHRRMSTTCFGWWTMTSQKDLHMR